MTAIVGEYRLFQVNVLANTPAARSSMDYLHGSDMTSDYAQQIVEEVHRGLSSPARATALADSITPIPLPKTRRCSSPAKRLS
jgi:hypothetical protein